MPASHSRATFVSSRTEIYFFFIFNNCPVGTATQTRMRTIIAGAMGQLRESAASKWETCDAPLHADIPLTQTSAFRAAEKHVSGRRDVAGASKNRLRRFRTAPATTTKGSLFEDARGKIVTSLLPALGSRKQSETLISFPSLAPFDVCCPPASNKKGENVGF